MWPDNETGRDFLNFSSVADTVAEIIVQAQGRPTSIGISGAWGVGKSSMIKLVRQALQDRPEGKKGAFLFVEFNAWLYQGYDDASAALLEAIATKLDEEAQSKKTGREQALELLGRVNWLRIAKLTAGAALAYSPGFPAVGLLASALGFENAAPPNSEQDLTPPAQIHAIRNSFEDTLKALNVTLIVLIDDLDRCLPETTISTLEAIRLLLFLKTTAFVIAADDVMIKHAVRRHFDGVDSALVTSYFDKLVQIPIRVPPLGTQEVRAYMMLLFVENSSLDADAREAIREKVCNQLAVTWRGKRVDRAFLETVYPNLPGKLLAQCDTSDRLAPLMASSSEIAGNPRLIKRFLNALSIRMAVSNANSVGVDEAVLAKMLLFERCGNPAAYKQLIRAVNEDSKGNAMFLSKWEERAANGSTQDLEDPWDDPFIREWLTIPPRVGDIDLRGVLYVSREYAPLVSPEDRLSSEAVELLAALLDQPEMAAELQDRLAALGRPESTVIMDRLLEQAHQEQEWGTPPILDACLAVVHADPSQGPRLGAFLQERPGGQITPGIVPKIGNESFAKHVFDAWRKNDVSCRTEAAIKMEEKNGNLTV